LSAAASTLKETCVTKCEKNPQAYIGDMQFSFKTTAATDDE
jgi:hypothetical protein